MKTKVTAISFAGLALILLAGCNRSNQQTTSTDPPPGTTAPAEPTPAPGTQTPLATPPSTQAPPAATPSDIPPRRESPRTRPPASSSAPEVAERPVEAVRQPPARVTPPPPVEVPAGTRLAVRTTNTLSTKTVQAGDKFDASLAEDLRVDNVLIAPRGARVEGRVVNADPGGRVKGVASLSVELTSLELANGSTVRLNTTDVAQQAQSSKKKDAAKIGIASGIGAAIGAIAGGGKGAAIGAGAGAGAGTGAVIATRGEAAVIPSESVLTFALKAPLQVQR